MKTTTNLIVNVLTLALLSPMASRAQNTNRVLVFTEESSTVLTATIGGVTFGSVTPLGTDVWIWSPDKSTIGATDHFSSFDGWLEPGNAALVNVLQLGGPGLAIHSDQRVSGGPVLADGDIMRDNFTFSYSDGTSETFSVQFFDLGDENVGHVPDQSSTLVLLLLAGMAMVVCLPLRKAWGL
jgi:hypothetical protein